MAENIQIEKLRHEQKSESFLEKWIATINIKLQFVVQNDFELNRTSL
jgi:hypothetical protein